MIKELVDFEPTTRMGRQMKSMIENGEHSDAHFYWFIYVVEKLQETIKHDDKAIAILRNDAELLIDENRAQFEGITNLLAENAKLKARVQNLGVSVSNLVEENELLKNRKDEVLVESGKRWTKLLKIRQILEEENE
jgi:hypothetical protein